MIIIMIFWQIFDTNFYSRKFQKFSTVSDVYRSGPNVVYVIENEETTSTAIFKVTIQLENF
jgi:hypothetical protein